MAKVSASPSKWKIGISICIDGEFTEKIGNLIHIDAEADEKKIFMQRCFYFWVKKNSCPFKWKRGFSIGIGIEVTEKNWMKIDAKVDGHDIFMWRCICFWAKVNSSPFKWKRAFSISIYEDVTKKKLQISCRYMLKQNRNKIFMRRCIYFWDK